jgi:nucleoside-diphosphate-sugar epimerase
MPFKEELPVNTPISPYAASKKSAESMSYTYHYLYGIDITILRYFTVYGPRQRPDMAIYKFVKAILNNEKIPIFGDGTQTRDFTFVDDVVEANILAAESNITGEIFNIGGSSKISVGELIKKIEEILGKKAIIEYIKKQKGDVRDTFADISKVKELLGWSPKVDINNGLKRYIKWYS